jgi:tRNA uridine 5-carbamoylmethylation protein Kti12
MPILLVSGIPSQKKHDFVLGLRRALGDTAFFIHQTVGAAVTKKGTACLKSVISNELKDCVVLVSAPAHIKSLRYEIHAISRAKKTSMMHIFFKDDSASIGTLSVSQEYREAAGTFIEDEERSEALEEARKAFELPRTSDKWDFPQIMCSHPSDLDFHLQLIFSTLKISQKKSVATGKMVPRVEDPLYLSTVKREINKVMDDYSRNIWLPLGSRREIESGFLDSIKSKPVAIEEVPELFADFMKKHLEI